MTVKVSVSAKAACSSSGRPQIAATVANGLVSLTTKPPRTRFERGKRITRCLLRRRVRGRADRDVAQLRGVAGQVGVAGNVAALADEVRDDARIRCRRQP